MKKNFSAKFRSHSIVKPLYGFKVLQQNIELGIKISSDIAKPMQIFTMYVFHARTIKELE